jgi:hypothetical protein
MKNIKFLFCITLVICGLLIMIAIAFGIANPNILMSSNWHVVFGTLALVTFFGIGYGIVKRQTLCKFVCKQFTDVKNESPPPYRIERYILRWWKYRDPIEENSTPVDLIDIPGRRSRYSDDEKRHAVEKWERIKQHPNGITIEAFLEHEFGITNGVLNVSKSTFYAWRRKFKNTLEEKKS